MKLFDAFPLKAIPPNLITCTGMTLAFLSIASAFAGQIDRAAWFITLCVLIDKLDGTVARKLDASSEFGIQMDSFSDLISFGLAPAALIWAAAPVLSPDVWGHRASFGPVPATVVLASLCIFHGIFAALRLAKFNVTTAEHPRIFHGLPSTLSGALIAILFLAGREQGLLTPQVMAVFPALLGINAILMVSNLPLPKLRRAHSQLGFIAQVILAIAIFVLIPLQMYFWLPLAVLVGYITVGFALGIRAEVAAS